MITESELGELRPLAKGGMAVVYDLPEYTVPGLPGVPLVYKKYKRKIRPVPAYGLEALVSMRDDWDPVQRRQMDASFNWIVGVVTDGSPGAAGVLLPRLHRSYFSTLTDSFGDSHEVLTECQYLVATREYSERVGLHFATMEERAQVCYGLVKAIGRLHRAHVVYGDMSHRNFIYRLAPKASVVVVDTDAVRPQGATSSLGLQPHTPDWEPPEALRAKKNGDSIGFAVQNYNTDRYKLGLAILRIMAADVPRAAERRDPRLVKRILPSNLYQLLELSLNGAPAERPTAKTWYEEMHR